MFTGKQIAIGTLIISILLLVGTMKFNWMLFSVAQPDLGGTSCDPAWVDHELEYIESDGSCVVYTCRELTTYLGQYRWVALRECGAVTTTIPIHCPWVDSQGNIVAYYNVGTQVGTMCIDGWFWIKTCQADGTWYAEKVEQCGTTTTTVPILCPNQCPIEDDYGNVVGCADIGTEFGRVCQGIDAKVSICQADGTWRDTIIPNGCGQPIECKDYCDGNVRFYNSRKISDYQCYQAVQDCGQQMKCIINIFGKSECVPYGGPTTTTTTTLVCPPNTCKWYDADANVVACYLPKDEVGRYCIDVDAYVDVCQEDGTWKTTVIEGGCGEAYADSICSIPHGKDQWFNVIEECEKSSGCGPLGQVGKLSQPLIEAIANLFGKEYTSRCELCSENYLNCKILMCNAKEAECRGESAVDVGCGIGGTFCRFVANFISIKVFYGEWIFYIAIILIIAVILALLAIYTVILDPILDKVLR